MSIVFPLTFQEHTVVSRFVYKLQEDSKRIELALVVGLKRQRKSFFILLPLTGRVYVLSPSIWALGQHDHSEYGRSNAVPVFGLRA